MPILEVITAAKDLSLAVAGVVTAVVAVRGLRNWNRELKGKASFEVARALAKATYGLRDAIRIFRSPLLLRNEFPDDYAVTSKQKSPEIEAQAYAHLFSARWKPVYAALQEFEAQTLEAEALWDREIRARTDELRQLVRKLDVAIEAFISNEHAANDHFQSNKEFGKQIRGRLFASPGDQDNEFSSSFEKAISAIQDELRPHLRRA